MRACLTALALGAFLCASLHAGRAEAADAPVRGGAIRELPCPDPKPRFDHTRVDRTLKEPDYGSDAPAYRFLAFGPEGRTLIAMVADESKGSGTGVDLLYADLNANGDLTEPAERFALKNPGRMRKAGGADARLVLLRLADWGVTVIPKQKLTVPDPAFDYTLSVGYGFIRVDTTTKDKSSTFPMRVMDNDVPWSTSKPTAPVIRFGGDEFSLGNERFARRAGKRLAPGEDGLPHVVPGDNIFLDGTAPFFLGSSPSVPIGFQSVYCPGGHHRLRATIVAGDRRVDVPLYASCGGNYWGSILVTTAYPHGRASLVLSMDTGSYLGTVVKRVPFIVDNPLFGKPVEPLQMTTQLRREHPEPTVVELYQGAPLPALGIPSYDGVRDVYFGDGRGRPFGGSCQNTGNQISYGTELRYRLDIGGEGRRTLIKYDLSMLPGDTRVARALLMLNVEGLNTKVDLDCRAYALKKRWHESIVGVIGGLNGTNDPAPRRVRYPVGRTENWDEPMFKGPGDRHAEPIGSVKFARAGWAAVDVTPGVRNWVSGRWENHGLALETVQERDAYGAKDVWMTSSDYAVDPRRRPRLILVLEGKPAPVAHKVEELNADLKAARSTAAARNKLILCNVLSAGSLTSRRFETRVLKAAPQVKRFIDRHFVEMRIDADDPRHGQLLKAWGVRRFPSAVVLPAAESPDDNFALIEPFDWDAMFGMMRSGFEFEQIYTRELQAVVDRARGSGGRLGSSRSAAGSCDQ